MSCRSTSISPRPRTRSSAACETTVCGPPSTWTGSEFWVRAQILERVPENQQVARLTQLLQSRTSNRNLSIIRLEQIVDSEGELQGYMAFAKP